MEFLKIIIKPKKQEAPLSIVAWRVTSGFEQKARPIFPRAKKNNSPGRFNWDPCLCRVGAEKLNKAEIFFNPSDRVVYASTSKGGERGRERKNERRCIFSGSHPGVIISVSLRLRIDRNNAGSVVDTIFWNVLQFNLARCAIAIRTGHSPRQTTIPSDTYRMPQ